MRKEILWIVLSTLTRDLVARGTHRQAVDARTIGEGIGGRPRGIRAKKAKLCCRPYRRRCNAFKLYSSNTLSFFFVTLMSLKKTQNMPIGHLGVGTHLRLELYRDLSGQTAWFASYTECKIYRFVI